MSKALPKLVTNRNVTLTSIYGHSIAFRAGVPTHVPPIVYQECLALGAIPEDGVPVDPDAGRPVVGASPTDPGIRTTDIRKAIDILMGRNERGDFTAAGQPSIAAVSKIVDYKVSSKEIASAWQDLHDEKGARENEGNG